MKTFAKISLVICLLVTINLALNSSGIFDATEDFMRDKARIDIFILVMSVGCSFAFPLSFCYIFAGLFFPLPEAWGACMAGLFASSTIGFFLGRAKVARRFVDGLKGKFKWNLSSQRCLFDINFFVRAIPGVPYWIQNLLLSAAGTPYKMYILVNMCVQGIIAGAMTTFSASLKESDWVKITMFALLAAVMSALYLVLLRFVRKPDNSA